MTFWKVVMAVIVGNILAGLVATAIGMLFGVSLAAGTKV